CGAQQRFWAPHVGAHRSSWLGSRTHPHVAGGGGAGALDQVIRPAPATTSVVGTELPHFESGTSPLDRPSAACIPRTAVDSSDVVAPGRPNRPARLCLCLRLRLRVV